MQYCLLYYSMLYIRSPELIHRMTGTLHPLTNIPSFPQPLGLQHISILCLYEFGFSSLRMKVRIFSISLSLPN